MILSSDRPLPDRAGSPDRPGPPRGGRLRTATIALLVLLLFGGLVRAQSGTAPNPELEARLDDLLRGGLGETGAHTGALVVDLTTGDTVYARHADRSFVPASGLKLITTGAALHLLGPSFRYRTDLIARGSVEDGVLAGDLLIRGSGDPSIGAEPVTDDPRRPLRRWARKVRSAGITRVEGRVVGVDSIFDEVAYGSGWSWDDLNYYYAVRTSGLSFNENCVDFAIRARRVGEPGSITWELDETDFVRVTNATRTIPADSSLEEGYERFPGTNHYRLSSRVPAGTVDEECLAVGNPTLFFAYELRRVLTEEGISVAGPASDADDPAATEGTHPVSRIDRPIPEGPSRRVATHTSPPLGSLVATVNNESHNLYAEQILKTLGRRLPRRPDRPRPGSFDAGIAAVDSFLVWAGADTARVRIVDGSGLSRKNLLTPKAQVQVLTAMRTHPNPTVRDRYLESLARPGSSGTLRYRFAGLPGEARIRGKTGFMTGVRTLTGYLTTAGGRTLAFTLMTNNFTGRLDPVDAIHDRFVSLLASQ